MKKESKDLIFMVILLALILGPGWVVWSHFEAKAFNRATGKAVTTWEAMFIQLRVQEGVK